MSVELAYRSVVGSQAYQRDQYRNSRHSGAISLSLLCGSMVLAQGQFRRRIGTNSCLSSGNSSFISCRLISTTIIGIAGVLARSFGQLDCRHSTVVVWLGSSIVPATGSFGWQCNASNRVVFVGVLAQILVFVCRRIGIAVVLFVSHGCLGTHVTT